MRKKAFYSQTLYENLKNILQVKYRRCLEQFAKGRTKGNALIVLQRFHIKLQLIFCRKFSRIWNVDISV